MQRLPVAHVDRVAPMLAGQAVGQFPQGVLAPAQQAQGGAGGGVLLRQGASLGGCGPRK